MPRGRHGNHVRGSSHPRWKGGRALSSHGYVKVQVGVAHPLADPNGYAYEHHVVLADAGMALATGDVTHHLNGDKTDNRIENLQVTSRSAHNTHHNKHRPRDRYGRLTTRELVACCETLSHHYTEIPLSQTLTYDIGALLSKTR